MRAYSRKVNGEVSAALPVDAIGSDEDGDVGLVGHGRCLASDPRLVCATSWSRFGIPTHCRWHHESVHWRTVQAEATARHRCALVSRRGKCAHWPTRRYDGDGYATWVKHAAAVGSRLYDAQ